MDGIKIGSFTFHIDNGGLLIIITTGDREDTYRFDPKESVNLLDFLAQHQREFNAAIKSPEAVLPSYDTVTRAQVEAWLEEAWRSGIPPELHIILAKTNREGEWVGVDFSHTTLAGSFMAETLLDHCLFRDAHLEGVELTWSCLRDCDFTGAIMSGAHFDLATFDRSILTKAKMIGCIANGSSFQKVLLTGANLSHSSFCGGDFRGADLSGADLTGCNLTGCEFGGANLRGAILKGANISDSRFDRASLIDANLEEASAKDGIIIDRQTEWRPRSGITAILREQPLDDLE